MAYIYRNPHQQALEAIEQEIRQRTQEIEFAKARLAELQQARKSVLPLAQAEVNEEITASLPVLCLRVLSFTPNHGVSATKIREGLKFMGVEVTGKNPMGILHTTLGRLEQNGYIRPVPTVDGQRSHFQITPDGTIYLQGTFTGPAPGGF